MLDAGRESLAEHTRTCGARISQTIRGLPIKTIVASIDFALNGPSKHFQVALVKI